LHSNPVQCGDSLWQLLLSTIKAPTIVAAEAVEASCGKYPKAAIIGQVEASLVPYMPYSRWILKT